MQMQILRPYVCFHYEYHDGEFPSVGGNLEEVIHDTLDRNSIDFTARRTGLSHDCVFRMRHKILFSLEEQLVESPIRLGDVTELDETFVLESYKRNKLPEGLGRKPRKHGEKAIKRGISSEYVCICARIQRNRAAMAHSVNWAKAFRRRTPSGVFRSYLRGNTSSL